MRLLKYAFTDAERRARSSQSAIYTRYATKWMFQAFFDSAINESHALLRVRTLLQRQGKHSELEAALHNLHLLLHAVRAPDPARIHTALIALTQHEQRAFWVTFWKWVNRGHDVDDHAYAKETHHRLEVHVLIEHVLPAIRPWVDMCLCRQIEHELEQHGLPRSDPHYADGISQRLAAYTSTLV